MTRFAILRRLLRDESGLSAVEYGLICGMIVVAMVSALSSFAGEIQVTWNNVSTQAQNATSQATGG